MIEVAIRNFSTSVTDGEVAQLVPALQIQVSRDFAAVWGIDAKLHLLSKNSTPNAGHWQLGIYDNSDQASALGYHDVTLRGLPIGKVFAKSTLDDGGLPSVTGSHELLEMLLDPTINLLAIDEHHSRAYAYEACDACEADALGYKINGVQVSDFVKPSFFEPDVKSVTKGRSFCNHVTGAFEIAKGGYLSYVNLKTGAWEQIDNFRSPSRVAKGSRAARRRTPVAQRRPSTEE